MITQSNFAVAKGIDTICWNSSIKKINLLQRSISLATDHTDEKMVWEELKARGTSLTKASQGFNNKIFWVAFTVKNCSTEITDGIIELDNPQIDVVTYYSIKKNGDINPLLLTGDRFPFRQRQIQHRNFLLPISIQPGEVKTYLLRLEKRKSSISFPLYLWERSAHREKDYNQNLEFGLFFGFILLCLLYSSLTFLVLRKAIYGWYTVWIIFSGLYISTALGFSHQYLYPGLDDFNSKARVYIVLFSTIGALKFLSLFLKVDVNFPRLYRIIPFSVYILLAAAVLVFFSSTENPMALVILPAINVMMLGLIGLLIFCAIKTYTHQKRTVLFFFAAFTSIFVGATFIVLNEFGVVSEDFFSFNPYLVGSSLELFFFSIGIILQIKDVYDDRNDLVIKMSRQQKEMLHAYLDGVEKERSRIAGELHDDIGSRLGNLRRLVGALTNDKKEYLEEQVEKISSDVRNLSHQLAPEASRQGLVNAVQHMIADFQNTGTTQFSLQCYDVPTNLTPDIHQQVYRMLQEACNNILKHAKARHADIQIFGHDQELVITVEDDGIGFDPSAAHSTLGLKQLRGRTDALMGQLEISSSPGKGTQIMIRIPLQNN